MNNCSHTCTLTRQAISAFDSLTACSKRVEADLVESRSEKFQENEKKKKKKKERKKVDLIQKVLKGTFISLSRSVCL